MPGTDAYNPEYSGIWMPNSSGSSIWNNSAVQNWAGSLYDPVYSGVVDTPAELEQIYNSPLGQAYSSGNLLSLVSPVDTNSGSAISRRRSGGSRHQPVNYIDAPIAERYGMNAQTAYNESLANTAHQREVQDLLKAGLNPVLSARYGGSSAPSTIYVPNSGSGSSGGSGGSYNSAQGANLFFKLVKGVAPELVGLVVGSKAGKSSGNSARNITKGLLNALF